MVPLSKQDAELFCGDFRKFRYSDWSTLRKVLELPESLDDDSVIVFDTAPLIFSNQDTWPFGAPSLSFHLCTLAADAFAFGALKYGQVGRWRDVPLDHHIQAAGRHFDAWLKDPASLDDESKLPHEAHFLARAVMIQELRRTR